MPGRGARLACLDLYIEPHMGHTARLNSCLSWGYLAANAVKYGVNL